MNALKMGKSQWKWEDLWAIISNMAGILLSISLLRIKIFTLLFSCLFRWHCARFALILEILTKLQKRMKFLLLRKLLKMIWLSFFMIHKKWEHFLKHFVTIDWNLNWVMWKLCRFKEFVVFSLKVNKKIMQSRNLLNFCCIMS